jgi:cephalosporin hydroxylase
MAFIADRADEIAAVKKWCAEHGTFSWTSPQYQNDILSFVSDNASQGDCVIEVGCYKGGLTALLALACKHSGLKLYSLDIAQESVESARSVLAGVGLDQHAVVERITLQEFVASGRFSGKPVLCILDGDHAYNAVILDLDACAVLKPKPYAIAFHDYSLRHPTTDERVSDAIDDYFGASMVRTLIGQPMNGSGHATKEVPQPDGHWWNVPGSEGAIVLMP